MIIIELWYNSAMNEPQNEVKLTGADNPSGVKLEDIVSLCKRRGFIYPGSDVYGGLAGTWDYGPYGVALKRNILQLWWKMFVEERDDMYGVDAAILMNQKVWQASGHVDTFTDPLISCGNCKRRYRTDHLVGDNLQKAWEYRKEVGRLDEVLDARLFSLESDDPQEVIQAYVGEKAQLSLNEFLNEKVPCEYCGKKEWGSPQQFNMMFATNIGPVSDDDSVSYLRPETAQGIFTNFKNVVDTIYPDVPFGIAQQGKAFRNEISPRDFVFRSREFEQMEIEYFVQPDTWEENFEHWVTQCKKWFSALGLPDTSVHDLEVAEADRAHYSKRTIDFEFDFPIGREELMGLAYRTDFDLMNIQNAAKKSMEYRPKDGSPAYVPHVIEPSFGVERAVMAVLCSAYWHDAENDRIVLRLPYDLAPVKVAVCPLAKNNPDLVAKAREIYANLKKEFGAALWIDSGNIGKNYRKMDEIGVPYVVTVDFDTLEGDTKDTVTVRSRDTTEQNRYKAQDLIGLLGKTQASI